MSLTDEVQAAEDARLQAKVDDLAAQLGATRKALSESERLRETAEKVAEYSARPLKPPKWLGRRPKKTERVATLCTVLSDLHLDERVDPAEVDGRNAYSREIAEQRMERYFSGVTKVARHYLAGLTYEGVVLFLAGDTISGDIHEELTESNEGTALETVLFWTDRLAAGIGLLADEFGRVHVPVVVGNHGRRTRKPRAKKRARDNFDWLIGQMLARHFHADERVTFQIPDSTDALVPVYDTTFLLTHGDQVGGGGGIGGIWPPLMRMVAKKRTRFDFDTLVCGHWHQLIQAPTAGLIVNGCFPAGALVATPNGPRPIERLTEGDQVFGGAGSLEVVTNTFEKSADALVSLHIRGLPHELTATPNHLVWSIKGEATRPVEPSRRHLIGGGDAPQWIPADFLSAGDWVHIPRPEASSSDRPITARLAWLYGLWLAEGHATINGGRAGRVNRIGLSMHRREESVLRRAAAIFEESFPDANKPLISFPATRPNSVELVVNGRDIAMHFVELFGKGAANKAVPPWFLGMAPDLQAEVVTGWITGDGHTRVDGVISATTISPDLAWAMFYMGFHTGRFPCLKRLRKGGPRLNDSYTVHMNAGQEAREVDGQVFYRIQNRFRAGAACPVYDLEVSGEHTYVVNGVHVHNSLKGYDEFAAVSNFVPERAQQAMWTVAPGEGCTISAPIFCDDKTAEGW